MVPVRFPWSAFARRSVAICLALSLVYQLGACPCGCWEGSRWAAALSVETDHAEGCADHPEAPSVDHAHEPDAGAAVLFRGAGRTPYSRSLPVIASARVDAPRAACTGASSRSCAVPRPAPPDGARPLLGVYLL